jgi:protocatechuate 3,4-dioxygenase beta subunit
VIPKALAIALVVIAAQQPRDGNVAPAGRSAVSGTVIIADTTAAPLRAAIVTLASDGAGPNRTALTDDQGRFVFRGVPAGRVTVSARKAGYLPMVFGARRPGGPGTGVIVRPDQTIADLVIRLHRASVITGTIVGVDGQPARDVSMQALRMAASPAGTAPTLAQRFVTDDRGTYRIYGLAPGEYLVVATPPVAGGTGSVSVRSTAEVDAVLRRLAQRAVPGAMPRAAAATDEGLPASATFGFVPIFYPGTAVAAEAQRIRIEAGEERTGVDFQMSLVRAGSIEGVVTSPEGPLGAVSLSITPHEPPGQQLLLPQGMTPTLTLRPDVDGRFQYSSVPPGRYTITARTSASGGPARTGGAGRGGAVQLLGDAAAVRWATAEVSISGDAVAGVALTLQAGLTLSGRVVLAAGGGHGPPDLAATRVMLRRDGPAYSAVINGTALGGFSVPPADVRQDGTFTFTGVVPGRYEFAMVTPNAPGWWLQSAVIGGRDLADVPFDIPSGAHISDAVLTLSDRRCAVVGTLHTAVTSPADYVVLIFPADRALWRPGSRRIKFTRVSADGVFSIRDLPPGKYLLGALTDIGPDEASDIGLLDQLVPVSVGLNLTEGEEHRQDLKLR